MTRFVKKSRRNVIGPHEGRELDLMLKGKKPLSMFVYPLDSDIIPFPERDFDLYVSKGLFKKVVSDQVRLIGSHEMKTRRVLYACIGEEWRIEAFLLVQALYDSLTPGWRPDLERVLGSLLGYDRQDIEDFIDLRS